MSQSQGQKLFAYLGCYADATSGGVIACSYDVANGTFEIIQEVEGLQNPTFLHPVSESMKLYALSEKTDAEGKRNGYATAYTIDAETGKLTLLNQEVAVPAPICHIILDSTNKSLMVASYHGGLIGISPVLEDGRVGQTSQVHQHEGSSVLPVQSQPRAHSVFIDPSNRYAVVPDLGLDKVIVYKLNAAESTLKRVGETNVAPGSGPRHFAFHPSLPIGYVINELNSTVTVFQYDGENGVLTEIQTISTLPEGYEEVSYCADIHVSPDGKFVYGSNRGHDSIVVYAVDAASGKLELVEHVSTLGGHPRNFALSPDARFVLVANRDGNNVVTFSRNEETGRLSHTGGMLTLDKPVCVKFLV